MSARTGTYRAALRATMRTTAAAYGYTLSSAATIGVLPQLAGKPDTGRLFLFALGGVTAFVVLEALLAAVRSPAPQQSLATGSATLPNSSSSGSGPSHCRAWVIPPEVGTLHESSQHPHEASVSVSRVPTSS